MMKKWVLFWNFVLKILKENEAVDPLRLEVVRLLRDAADRSNKRVDTAVRELYSFTKKNSSYDIMAVLGEPQYTKYFQLFIKRQLDMLRVKEGIKFCQKLF